MQEAGQASGLAGVDMPVAAPAAPDRPADAAPSSTPDDVVNAYRAVLGRNPESEAVFAAHLRRSPPAIAAVLARSGEFRSRLRDVAAGRLTSHASLSRQEVTATLRWARGCGLLPEPGEDMADSPALLLIGLLDHPALQEPLAEAPEDVRDAAARLRAAPAVETALHRLTRAAEAVDAAALDLILSGMPGPEGGPPEPPAGQPLHALIAERLGRPALQESVLRALGSTAPLPVFDLDAPAMHQAAAWLATRLGAAVGDPLLAGGLLAALLRVPAVDDLVHRLWPAEHATAMGALPGLASGALQLAAQRVTTEDVGLAYLAVLGRSPETTIVRRAHEGAPLAQMLTTLLASAEFRAHVLGRLAGGAEAIPHHALSGEQRRQLGHWLGTRLGAPAGTGDPAPLHPMALLARLTAIPALDAELSRLHGVLWADARAALAAWLREGAHALLGAIDYVTGDWIAGWALDRAAAGPIDIEIHCNGRLVAFGRADRPRPGAAAEEGEAAGACGFRLPWRGRAGPAAGGAEGYRFQILAARSGVPIGPAFLLDSVFVSPRSTLQMIAQELRQARATLDRLERMMPQLESFTGYPLEHYAAFRRAHRLLPPPAGAASLPPLRVVVPGVGVSLRGLRRTLHALQEQTGVDWEAVVLAATPEQRGFAEAVAAREPRITVRMMAEDDPGGLAAERAVAAETPADVLLLLLPPGAMPAPLHALAWFAAAAARCPDSPGFFCDEDAAAPEFRDGPDRHDAPIFRTALDPWTLPAGNPCGEALCGRAPALAAALDTAGGCGDRAAQRWVAWAALAKAGPVAHIPRLLLTVQTAEVELPPAADAEPPAAALRPLLRHPWLLPGAEPPPDPPMRLSVIVPTRNGGPLVAEALGSLLEKAATPGEVEAVVVDNGSDRDETLAILADLEARGVARILRLPEPFNWSRLNNLATRATSGEALLFLNDDTRMLSAGWDRDLRQLLAEPDVGAVGARLLYEDLTIQHAGVLFGTEALAAHEGVGAAMDEGGPGGRWQQLRAVGGVTGAFLACRRDVFERVGPFDEHAFGITFNDVDLCLRLRAAGLAVLYAPAIALVHYESKTRGFDDLDAAKQERAAHERRLLAERWGAGVLLDPGFNPYWSRWSRPFAAIREPSQAEILGHLAASASADPWNPLTRLMDEDDP